jgi:hypothetical protein
MSLDVEFQLLENDIFNGYKSVALFVVDCEHYYVVDDKCNYCIDVRPDYLSYVESGRLNAADYERSLRLFRGGVSVLSSVNFREYIDGAEAEIKTVEWMREFFLNGYSAEKVSAFYSDVERFLSFGKSLDWQQWDFLRMKLPSFYINFDRGIYRHTDWDRLHEELALPKDRWDAKAGSDFGLLIPDKQQYWLTNQMNFWKLYGR